MNLTTKEKAAVVAMVQAISEVVGGTGSAKGSWVERWEAIKTYVEEDADNGLSETEIANFDEFLEWAKSDAEDDDLDDDMEELEDDDDEDDNEDDWDDDDEDEEESEDDDEEE